MSDMDSVAVTHNATTGAATLAGSLAGRLLPEVQTLELLVAVSIFVEMHSLRQRRSQGLPCWPVVGMLPSLLLGLRADMYEWITGVLRSRGGTFTFRGPWFTNLQCVVTADPRNLEHLLKTRFGSFPKGPYFRATVRDLLGDGIFGADGVAWRRQRKPASLEFHSAEFRALTASSLVELVHRRRGPRAAGRAPPPHLRQRVRHRVRRRPGLPPPGAPGHP
jgi:fatty acid omega-hydroxylase